MIRNVTQRTSIVSHRMINPPLQITIVTTSQMKNYWGLLFNQTHRHIDPHTDTHTTRPYSDQQNFFPHQLEAQPMKHTDNVLFLHTGIWNQHFLCEPNCLSCVVRFVISRFSIKLPIFKSRLLERLLNRRRTVYLSGNCYIVEDSCTLSNLNYGPDRFVVVFFWWRNWN